MIIDTARLSPGDRLRLADLLAGLLPTDSLYPIAARLQNEATGAAPPERDPIVRLLTWMLAIVEGIQARRAVRRFLAATFPPLCLCGHDHHAHDHCRPVRDCAVCWCGSYRQARHV